MAASMVSVFGTKDIADIVKSFDFSKRDETRDDYLTVGLAPSFGKLDRESIKKTDEQLKVAIAGTTRLIGKIPPNQRTWEKVVSTLNQNPLIESMDDGIQRSDKLVKKKNTNAFKFDGSPDASIVREVYSWFINFIHDEDVINSTNIDISVMARIVAQTGATIDSFQSIFGKHEHHQKMIDISVLRFPDQDHPYFKVYRIKLDAWSDSSRIVFIQEDSNGITGEFNVRRYKPRKSTMDGISKEVIADAVKEAENIFA